MAHLSLNGEPLVVSWIVCKVVNLLILAPAGKKQQPPLICVSKANGKTEVMQQRSNENWITLLVIYQKPPTKY